MKRKRAPGGGRKPQGPSKGNTARLSLRVTPDIRRALKVAAEKHGRSLSQEAQFHLQQSLSRFYHPRPDIIVLTEVIARAIQDVERTTHSTWKESAYTTAVIRAAIDALVRHFGASGEPQVPLAIKELAGRLPDDYAKKSQEPTEVGSWAAGRLIMEIEARALNEGEGPHKLPAEVFEPPEWDFYRQTVIPRLGSRWKRRERRR